ncbi:hypothetical protein R5R73_10210 [Salinicola sp. LHM]|jgi:hypothetical protein|uniref:hypothetical protein n=1 Tax=Salinicola sp. LHM TaxID=3065298 RepID=UPI002ACE4A02|nr:hypothetical protein [Salinicola sp. LHM]WQH31455.1 hypothetical protein R5R73_10210 [Salinicola sp. LHM]
MFTKKQWALLVVLYVVVSIAVIVAGPRPGEVNLGMAGAFGQGIAGLILGLIGGVIGKRIQRIGATAGIVLGYVLFVITNLLI